MIQDIFPHKLYNQYDPEAEAGPDDYVLHFHGAEVLSGEKKQREFPKVSDFLKLPELTYLFSVDHVRYFRPEAEEIPIPEGFVYQNAGKLREAGVLPKLQMYALMTAKHLSDWYRDNHYCGRCGGRMEKSSKERAMVCTDCGYTCYPRIMPAVIAGVIRGDEILITRYKGGFRHNALIAGFTEIGETVEETVEREVMEEAGVHVKNIRYYKSQPWGIANDLLLGFFCEVDGDSEIHMDENELSVAEWTKREDVILQPDDLSLTNEMMMQFKLGKV